MSYINSSNMQLPIPTVGSEQGPQYAFDINTCMGLIDTHDHSPGRGVKITPAGLNINSALNLQSNLLQNATGISFTAQNSVSSVIQSLSVSPGTESPTPLQDLWYTDSAGNQIQITAGGQLAPVATTVSGISYSTGTFSFKQTQDALPLVPANLDVGSVIIRPNTASTTNGVKLQNNAGIASQYNFIFPAALPSAAAFMTLDNSGNVGVSTPLLGALTTANLSTTAGILGTQIAANTITDSNITVHTITGSAAGSGGSIALGTIQGNGSSPGSGNIATATIAERDMYPSTNWTTTTTSGTLTNSNVTKSISSFIPAPSRPIHYNFLGYMTVNGSNNPTTITITVNSGLSTLYTQVIVVTTTVSFPLYMGQFNFTTTANNVGSTHTTSVNLAVSGDTTDYTNVEMIVIQ